MQNVLQYLICIYMEPVLLNGVGLYDIMKVSYSQQQTLVLYLYPNLEVKRFEMGKLGGLFYIVCLLYPFFSSVFISAVCDNFT